MIYNQSELMISVVMLIAFIVIRELGYRWGISRRQDSDEAVRAHVSSLQSALLGLLALLLGFTFAMSVSRYDTRKELVLQEANAIGTAYLRAQLLEDAYRNELSGLLRNYVDARDAFFQAGADRARLEEANARSVQLHGRMWAANAKMVRAGPATQPMVLFTQSLNEVIDLHERRVQSREDHVPELVLWLLFAVAAVSFGFIGYGSGLAGRRHLVSSVLLAVLVVAVLAVILDIDRPRRGLIQVGQDSMVRLKAGMQP